MKHIVEIEVDTDIGLFDLVDKFKKMLQSEFNKGYIKNNPMYFITTEYQQVEDEYIGFKGINNGSGYRTSVCRETEDER